MKLQLIRHATLILSINNKRILVDPILGKAGSMTPIANVPNQNFNPLVELPVDMDFLTNCDAVLVTHTHRDHFDDAAARLLSKDTPIFCQPEDEIKFHNYGFKDVHPISTSLVWNQINFNRTGGKHGHGKIAEQMAPVSGFVISCAMEPVIYIAGDTVWCEEVDKAIQIYKPEIVVCNAGSAQFEYGEPITMTAEDLNEIYKKNKNIKIAAVHMDSWNHCRLLRKDLRKFLSANKIINNIFIPEDGEVLNF